MKDTYLKIKQLGEKDSQLLRVEYKEWFEASENENKQPHVLYMNQIQSKS